MILTIKAIIYRYTGIYLASKELQEYSQSFAFKKEMFKIKKQFPAYSADTAESIVLGKWEAKYGFYRPLSYRRFYDRTLLGTIRATIEESYEAIRLDVKIWLWKLRNKV